MHCYALLQGIPQMEPLVMEAIPWAFKPTIQSVHPQEPQVLEWRASIASTLTAALYPTRQYIAKVQAYCGWLAIDPVAYLEGFQVNRPMTTLTHTPFWLHVVACLHSQKTTCHSVTSSVGLCQTTARVLKRQGYNRITLQDKRVCQTIETLFNPIKVCWKCQLVSQHYK